MVATTRGANSPRKLKFTDKIVTKGLTTDALVKKMRALHTELASIDQDNVDTNTLQGIRKELISTSILLHKDKGVRALAACCIADLLRLYAPDAPYTAPELKDIFQFFFRQLSTGLRGPDAPYYNEYFYLLESLASIKSIVLVCDIPAADELLCTIFRNIFDLVPLGLPKNVESFMSEILVALIEECATLPPEVLEILLAQFLPARNGSPPHRLSVDVCKNTADKLQRHVAQYFGDLLVQHSSGDQGTIPQEDVEELQNAHQLVQSLAQEVPSLLLNVIPQLEEELRVTDQTIRSIATQTLGAIFGSNPNGAKLARTYNSTWTQWLARKNDRVATVRVLFVEATKGILVHHGELRSDMEEALKGKFMDPDDKVRAAVCKLFSQIGYEAALHHVTKAQLEDLAGRCLDRKPVVRQEAFNSIGRLYSLAYPEIESNDLAAIPQFAWIPEKLLEASAMPETWDEAEKCISEFVLPLPAKGEDIVPWTERLLLVMKYLSGGCIGRLLTLTNLRLPRPSLHERFLQCCVDYNGGVVDKNEEEITKNLNAAITLLTGMIPESGKQREDLRAFAKLNESRLYKLLRTCMDPQTDLKTLIKTTTITAALKDAQDDTLIAHVAVLAEAAKSSPEAFEDKSDVIMNFLVQGLLMVNTSSTSDAMITEDNDEEWAEDSQLNGTGKAKILALKVMHNRCLAHAESDAALDMCAPVFKLLFSILENGGSVNPSVEYDPMIKARLRLQAAVSLLKLSSIEIYANLVLKNLIMLATTLQDTSFRVRSELLNKFVNMVVNRKLGPNFYVLAFITAHDPEKEIRDRARNWVTIQMRRLPVEARVQHFDMLFIRLLHLLAHHPDFSETGEGLQDMAKAADDANGKEKEKKPARKRKAAASGRTNGTSKKPRRPKKADTWREQSDEDESNGEMTSESDEDPDAGTKSKGREGQTRSREERLARRSRGGEKKEETDGDEVGGDEDSEQDEESDKEETPKAKTATRTQPSRSRK
ncbi:hypothetical protein FRC07_009533 [Ceratobasidium sp. 392]|nr:hypothetical protein FRC07_009533 [Ceratobasidium sp. 392]